VEAAKAAAAASDAPDAMDAAGSDDGERTSFVVPAAASVDSPIGAGDLQQQTASVGS